MSSLRAGAGAGDWLASSSRPVVTTARTNLSVAPLP